jgi:hypothetical protein
LGVIERFDLRAPAVDIPSPVGAHAAARIRPVIDRHVDQRQARMAVGAFERGARFTAEFAIGARAAARMLRTPRNDKLCAEAPG